MHTAVNVGMNIAGAALPANGPPYVPRPPPGMSMQPSNAPPCRPCTQCTYLIPAADPYRMCKVCRREARERARKRRIKVLQANPEFPDDVNQDDAIRQYEHTMLPRGEYRQIESDQNADPNVGRKRMRLTEGSTSLQGISNANVFGTAQEQGTVLDIFKPPQEQSVLGEELQSNIAHTYLTRDLTNYTKPVDASPSIPPRSSDTSSLDDPGMYLGSLLGQTAIHYKPIDRSKTPPRPLKPVIDLCSPEMSIAAPSAPYTPTTSPTRYSSTFHETKVSNAQPQPINTHPSIANIRQATLQAQSQPSYALNPDLNSQQTSLNFHTSANFAPPAPDPVKKRRKPRVCRPRPDAPARQQSAPSRQESVPLPGPRTLVPCEPSRQPPVPAPRAVSGPVPRASAKLTSRRSVVASVPRATPLAPAQSRYPWPYCYYAPNYGQAASSAPSATQNSDAQFSGPTTSSASERLTSAAPKPATAPSTSSLNSQTSAPAASPALFSATISTSTTASPSLYTKSSNTPSQPAHFKSPQTPATTPTADAPDMDLFGHLHGAALDEQLMRDLCALVDGPSSDVSIQQSDGTSAAQTVAASATESALPAGTAAASGEASVDLAEDLAWLDTGSGDLGSVFDFDVEKAISGWEGQDSLCLEPLSWDNAPWLETHSHMDDLFGESQDSPAQEMDAPEPAQSTSDEWAALFQAHEHDNGYAFGAESVSEALVGGADFGVWDGMTATELGDEDA